MDRRQRKSRESIFNAFTALLAQKDFNQITVGEIIDHADVGRATFYSHFETKDYLLKEFCEELFCHIFDTETGNAHKHIFSCDGSDSVILHLFQHLQRNDNNILALLSSRNNDIFIRYFRSNLEILVERHSYMFESKRNEGIPDSFWKNHIVSTLAETIKWWIENGIKESPKVITDFFFKVI